MEEEKFLEQTRPSENNEITGDEIDIVTFIPKELENLQERLKLIGNPFEDSLVKYILENLILRRSVEVYLTTNMDSEEIVNLINERFRLNLTVETLETYEYWFYDIAEMSPDQLDSYFSSLPKEEKEYKYMAYMDKEDYVKWKMRAGGTLNKKDAIRQIMEDAFFNFKESVESENISHAACRTWSDIFFKAADYLENSEDKGGIDIFKKFKFNLINICFHEYTTHDTNFMGG
jgi:hypothetical protein